jgi:hypothetical protein
VEVVAVAGIVVVTVEIARTVVMAVVAVIAAMVEGAEVPVGVDPVAVSVALVVRVDQADSTAYARKIGQ